MNLVNINYSVKIFTNDERKKLGVIIMRLDGTPISCSVQYTVYGLKLEFDNNNRASKGTGGNCPIKINICKSRKS